MNGTVVHNVAKNQFMFYDENHEELLRIDAIFMRVGLDNLESCKSVMENAKSRIDLIRALFSMFIDKIEIDDIPTGRRLWPNLDHLPVVGEKLSIEHAEGNTVTEVKSIEGGWFVVYIDKR